MRREEGSENLEEGMGGIGRGKGTKKIDEELIEHRQVLVTGWLGWFHVVARSILYSRTTLGQKDCYVTTRE